MENNLLYLLVSLGICSKDEIHQFHPKVRDRDDISVLRCKKSGVILLSQSDHMDISHYEEMNGYTDWTPNDQNQINEDDSRRADQFRNLIKDKKWLDLGTGRGGILKLLKDEAKEAYAVEPQTKSREQLKKQGFKTFKNLSEITSDDFEIITLFHVFEHIVEPIKTLSQIYKKLSPGGKIIIEVPHAKNFLIHPLNLKSFKDFTFWSEHLILHTKNSLKTFIQHAGFKNISIKGFQRYPLSNNLYWIIKGKPGGHVKWKFLNCSILNGLYESFLKSIDATDTLIAIAEK